MTTTYIYPSKKGMNTEVFDTKGYVTLTRDGKHVYEHQFSTTGVKIQEMELVNLLDEKGVEFTKEIVE